MKVRVTPNLIRGVLQSKRCGFVLDLCIFPRAPMNSNLCIYCLRESITAPEEPVIPEFLGRPDAAILRSRDVCEACNHGLGHLDVALAGSFDFVRFFTNQPTKKGKAPSVTGRCNIATIVTDGEPIIHINMGPGDITLPDGRVLKAPTTAPSSVKAQMTVHGREAEIRFQAQAFQNPKFSRAVHRVAIGIIAGMLGRNAALAPSLNPAREFVLRGAGPKRIVLCRIPTAAWKHFHRAWSPYASAEGYCVVVTLCDYQLRLDCTPTHTSIPRLRKLIPTLDPQARWLTLS